MVFPACEGDDVTAAESEASEVADGPSRAQAILLVGWLVVSLEGLESSL